MATEAETKSHVFYPCGGEGELYEGVTLRILEGTFKCETRVEWSVLPEETNDVISCFPAIDLVAIETETDEEVELFDRHAQIIYKGANQGSDYDIEADLEYIPHHYHGNSHLKNHHLDKDHLGNGRQSEEKHPPTHIPRQEVDPERPEAVSVFHTYYCLSGSDVIIYTQHFSKFKLCCPEHRKNKKNKKKKPHLAARLFWKETKIYEADGPRVEVDLKVILDIKHLPLKREFPEDWPIADYRSYNLVEDPVDLPTPGLMEPTTSFNCSVTLPDGSGWTTDGNCYEQPRELGRLQLCPECHHDYNKPEAAMFQFLSTSANPRVLRPKLNFTITKPKSGIRQKEFHEVKSQRVVLYNPDPHLAEAVSQPEEEMDTTPYPTKSSESSGQDLLVQNAFEMPILGPSVQAGTPDTPLVEGIQPQIPKPSRALTTPILQEPHRKNQPMESDKVPGHLATDGVMVDLKDVPLKTEEIAELAARISPDKMKQIATRYLGLSFPDLAHIEENNSSSWARNSKILNHWADKGHTKAELKKILLESGMVDPHVVTKILG